MKQLALFALLSLSLLVSRPLAADVVINEIFYHAPDDLDGLQWIELHNSGTMPVDISGWRLGKSIEFTFPANSSVPPGGFLVLCKDAQLFSEFYDARITGEFNKSFARSGATVELVDAAGKQVDWVKFGDRDPWPTAADGISASLERITPNAPGQHADNWSASPLPEDMERPVGTPGRVNASFSENFPPIIKGLSLTPGNPAPGQGVRVTAVIDDDHGIASAEVYYAIVRPGIVSDEVVVPLTAPDGKTFSAELPGFDGSQLVRVRVRAVDRKQSERYFPSPNSLRPALSFYVQSPADAANIPLAFMINTDPHELAAMERLRRRALHPSVPRPPNP
ncbi:MAG: lamin tail domain-containing protein [Planctomycetales bacterium]